ncbi:hypothetical protein [Paenibacillus qinlingensis]|uniref:Golvesin/Xly CBD-like domain-containing protein n=1 Tax=Paenibacillus qinlingensis TaxID=1837343 RepID=A0ABU1NS51_9BACL|nr:hypothetical protein [Paenibacillus qinlingensis]MDR6550258.1 hypothetical protein [Paenibacillus qinlingensis]
MIIKHEIQSAKKVLTASLALLFIVLILGFAQSAKAASVMTNTDQSVWNDTAGNPIWAQGGWMIKEDDTFLWYGMDYSESGVKNVNLLKSTDMVNWTKQASTVPSGKGIVDFSTINPKLDEQEGTYAPGKTKRYDTGQWIGRPVVAYNSANSQYVMITEWNSFDNNIPVFGRNKLAFFTSSSAEGPFTFQRYIARPSGYSMGDLGSIFTDDDGSTYITFTVDVGSNWNGGFQLSKLTSNYLDIAESTKFFGWTEGNKEATTLIKRGSQYYLFASMTNGFKSTPSYYYTTSSLSGAWTYKWDLLTSPSSSNSFDTQIDQILPIQGTEGLMYVYLGDRWSNSNFNGSTGIGRNGWYPLTFNSSGVPTVNGYKNWEIDAAAGTWTPVVPTEPVMQTLLSDNFEDGNALGWTALNGSWSVVTDATYAYEQSTNIAAEAVTTAGDGYWTNYDIQADISPKSATAGAATGIIGRYVDNNNYYLLRLSTNQVQLLKKVNGTFTTLAYKSYTVNPNSVYNLKLSMRGSTLVGSVNGVNELTVNDTSHTAGKIGLRTYNQVATFDNVLVKGVQVEVIVDNNDSAPAFTTTGAWTSSTFDSGYYNSSYFHDGAAAANADKSAVWKPTITEAGNYKVFMRWPAAANRPTSAPLEITYGGLLDTTKTVNQTLNGNTWVDLGTYTLTASSTNNTVKIIASAPGYTIADAVRFLKQ